MSEHTIPCEICGKATTSRATKRCDHCWEVEHRLEAYLKNPKGQEFARSKMPLLDDWVDGTPDAWNYEAVLTENGAVVEWSKGVVDEDGNRTTSEFLAGWSLSWKHGSMFIGGTSEIIARKAGALFICLWLRGVSASFADKIMDGFVVFLERQDYMTSGTMAKIVRRMSCMPDYLHVSLGSFAEEDKLLRAMGLQEDDQVGVTIRKPDEKEE